MVLTHIEPYDPRHSQNRIAIKLFCAIEMFLVFQSLWFSRDPMLRTWSQVAVVVMARMAVVVVVVFLLL